MDDYMSVVYDKKEGGRIIMKTFNKTFYEAKLDIESFKELYGSQYPEACGSIYNRRLCKWVRWKSL